MSENKSINEMIVDIIKKNPIRTDAIKQLFKMTSAYQNKNLKTIQDAILYLFEGEHDWQNISKFIALWKREDWGVGFVQRMKQRLQEEKTKQIKPDQVLIQIERLNQLYWQKNSPQKSVPSYEEYLASKTERLQKVNPPPDLSKLEPQKPEIVHRQYQPRKSFLDKIPMMTRQKNESSANNIIRLSANKKEKIQQQKQKEPQNKIKIDKQGEKLFNKPEVNFSIPNIPDSSTLTPVKNLISQPPKIKADFAKNQNSEQKDFQFSIVKSRRKSYHPVNPVSVEKKSSEVNDSFFSFASEPKEKKSQNINTEDFEQYEKSRRPSTQESRPLFRESEMAFIDPNSNPRDHTRQILQLEGKRPLQLFDKMMKAWLSK